MKAVSLNAIGKAVILLLLTASILFVEHIGILNGVNNYFYDIFFRLRGHIESSKNIVIIAIDDKTLEKLGRWPIRRVHYAHLLTWLRESDTVAFDIIFAEPADDDAALEDAVTKHGRVVLPIVIDDRTAVIYPVINFAQNRAGHIHVEQGIDGIVREVHHTLLYKNISLPSFSSVIYESAYSRTFNRQPHELFQSQLSNIVQLDRMNINYSGGTGTFERISLSDVLEGLYPPSYFQNKICLVGITATGLTEILLTPFLQERQGTPGVEVHANILNNLILDNAIHAAPYWIRWLSAIFFVLLSFICFLHMSEMRATILALFMLLCIAMISYLLFSMLNIWVSPSIFLFAIISVFITAYIFKFNDAVIRLDKAYLTVISHLRRHDAPESIQNLAKGVKSLLTPGGVSSKAQVLAGITDQLIFEKELTDKAIFSDLQGVLLFDPDKTNVLTNNLAGRLCRDNSLDTTTIDGLLKGLAGFIADKIDIGSAMEKLYLGDYYVTFSVSFPLPKKKFFKVDISSLTIEEKIYPLFVFSDITPIKELEILKNHLVSLVSHEIKTPLMSIQGMSEMLANDLAGEMKEYSAIIQKESERLIRFLNTFLDISRIEEGRQPIRLEPVILTDIVKEAAHELKEFARQHRITIRTDISEEISPAMIDKDLTKQCLLNLVENAIKYSPPDSEVILKLNEDDNHIRIETIDFGMGIRQDEIDKVFEKFYRAGSNDTQNIRGSGIGLTFVREAVMAQGGIVSVESRYGEGSKFSIIFPIKR